MENDQLVNALLEDRRRDRLWRNVRFFCWIGLAVLLALIVYLPMMSGPSSSSPDKPYVALVRLNGVIKAGSDFSARKVLPVLQKAFKDKKAKGVVLVINSPGGSPVQASIIHDKIEQLKKKYKKKVIVVGRDALASGAYLVATAADKIYVNNDTLTGSIGVIMSGFGFNDAIAKIGVSRRVFTAGVNKDRLDPFRPLTEKDKLKVHNLLNMVHQNFINDVLKGRKGKLRGDKNELFSGDFWTGQKAVQLGLADGTGNLWTILPKEFDVTHYKTYNVKPSLFEALTKGMNTMLENVHVGLSLQAPTLS